VKKLNSFIKMALHKQHSSDIEAGRGSLKDDSSSESTSSHFSHENQKSENLYHIMITQSHLNKDVNSAVEKIRVCGTYTSLEAAKSAAHRCLFDAGYEKEWFTEFDFRPSQVPARKRRPGLVVYAVAPDKTTFSVSIVTTSNSRGYKANKDGKVMLDLYHVLQTAINYSRDVSGEERESNIEDSLESYEEAWKKAHEILLCESDGITKSSFADYYEAGRGEQDCGFEDNVVVHAVGQNGVNYLVSIAKSQELEAVRLAEAATRIR
jgi:hypothetical protein